MWRAAIHRRNAAIPRSASCHDSPRNGIVPVCISLARITVAPRDLDKAFSGESLCIRGLQSNLRHFAYSICGIVFAHPSHSAFFRKIVFFQRNRKFVLTRNDFFSILYSCDTQGCVLPFQTLHTGVRDMRSNVRIASVEMDCLRSAECFRRQDAHRNTSSFVSFRLPRVRPATTGVIQRPQQGAYSGHIRVHNRRLQQGSYSGHNNRAYDRQLSFPVGASVDPLKKRIPTRRCH